MFFTAVMDIDPSQITEIKKIKQTSFASKILNVLSFGLTTEKKEHETFTAISILEQVYNGLKSINVDNIVRLSVDNFDFYLDDTGREQDLEDVVEIFNKMIDPLSSKLFDSLYLVIEHLEQSIKYLIEIRVKRKHQVGEYPISLIVNGVLNDFKLDHNETTDKLINRLNITLNNQEELENYISTKKMFFNEFIQKLEQMIKTNIPIDDLKLKKTIDVIKPNKSINSIDEIEHKKDSFPVFYGYYGFDYQIFYCFFWQKILEENNLSYDDSRYMYEDGLLILDPVPLDMIDSEEYDNSDDSSSDDNFDYNDN